MMNDSKHYTTEYVEKLPENVRVDLIDGCLYYASLPGHRHQQLLVNLSRKIADYIDNNSQISDIYIRPFAVYLNNDNKTYVEPDISVICDKNKLDEKGCSGAPDWIIEIVSPSSRRMDYFIKLFKYRNSGNIC